MQIKISLDSGKYTYLNTMGKQSALRYNEPWRDLTGDKFVFAMACKIDTLQYKGVELIRALRNIEDNYPETKGTFDAVIKSFQSEL